MSMTEVNSNLEALRDLTGKMPAARVLAQHLLGRRKDMKETTVDRLEAGTKLSRGDVIRVLKEYQKLGFGRLVAGRRGWQSRFQWEVSLVSVGKAALGTAGIIEEIPREETEGKAPDNGSGPDQRILRHPFQLRPDYQVSLDLPSDLSDREASRLADFVRTLPFERS